LGEGVAVVARLADNDSVAAWHFAFLRLGAVCGEKEVGDRE